MTINRREDEIDQRLERIKDVLEANGLDMDTNIAAQLAAVHDRVIKMDQRIDAVNDARHSNHREAYARIDALEARIAKLGASPYRRPEVILHSSNGIGPDGTDRATW